MRSQGSTGNGYEWKSRNHHNRYEELSDKPISFLIPRSNVSVTNNPLKEHTMKQQEQSTNAACNTEQQRRLHKVARYSLPKTAGRKSPNSLWSFPFTRLWSLLILFLAGPMAFNASAAGVSSPVWFGEYAGDPDEKPLYLHPGESEILTFHVSGAFDGQLCLASIAAETDYYNTKYLTEYGGYMAQILAPNPTTLVVGGYRPVYVQVSMPSDAPIGTRYAVGVDFTFQAAPGGMFGSAIGKGFPVVALVPEPASVITGALLLLPFGASTLRMLRKNRKA